MRRQHAAVSSIVCPISLTVDLRSNAVALDDATVVCARSKMRKHTKRVNRTRRRNHSRPCAECSRNRAATAKLEKRVSALEAEVNGPPAEELLEEFRASIERREARLAAIKEYRRQLQDELYKDVPWAREMEERARAKYEAFMKERGFEP